MKNFHPRLCDSPISKRYNPGLVAGNHGKRRKRLLLDCQPLRLSQYRSRWLAGCSARSMVGRQATQIVPQPYTPAYGLLQFVTMRNYLLWRWLLKNRLNTSSTGVLSAMAWLQQLLPVARYLLRIDAECGDHFVQADLQVPLPGDRISSLRKDEHANSQQTLRRKV